MTAVQAAQRGCGIAADVSLVFGTGLAEDPQTIRQRKEDLRQRCIPQFSWTEEQRRKESGMKEYVKPVVLENEELMEGVYAASGSEIDGECYTVTTNMHQDPQDGRLDYRIQVSATHAAPNNHHSSAQELSLSFNQPVTYRSSSGTLSGGDGTSNIQIQYTYHNNGSEYIGMGDVVVSSNEGLAINGATLSCNHTCNDGHSW